jgi:hypothetical protein
LFDPSTSKSTIIPASPNQIPGHHKLALHDCHAIEELAMLNLFPGTVRNCDCVSRRSFLQVGALSGMGVTLPMALAQQALAKSKPSGSGARGGSDMNCILIWTQGGTSHHDTFDPKPNAPISVKGEYDVIDTAVPGVQFTEILPRNWDDTACFEAGTQ